MKINNLSIIGKNLTVLFIFGVFVIGTTIFTTNKMRAIDDAYSDLSDHNAFAGVMLARANARSLAIRSSIQELLIAQSDADNAQALRELATARDSFDKFIANAAAALPAHAGDYQTLKRSLSQAVDTDCAEAIRLGSLSTGDATIQSQKIYLAQCAPAFAPIAAAFTKTVDDTLAEAKVINDATTDVTNGTIATTWAIILGGLVLVMTCGYFAIRSWISRPLNRLGALMSALAGGDLDAVVTGTERKDEIGAMARVVQVFKEGSHAKLRLEGESIRQRQAAEEEQARSATQRTIVAQEQASVVEAVASGLNRLSNGSLSFRITQSFAPEYETLRVDFNGAMEKLQDTMKVVSSTASAIRSGTDEISSAADDLSRRTEQQAASLEETAAALDEITATVRKTAEGSKHAREVVGQAKQAAEHSGRIVRQAVEAMSGIEKSSGQIGQIIGVIDEIAFQTNLLALNAGVEAARAGDAGRGFAVVASEVRSLAQRSADAAKEIKALISASSTEVERGVDLVGQTGQALGKIVTHVAEINGIVGEIAASAQEQASGLDQVNTAVNQMDQVTQQNAAMVEQSTAASHALGRETDELSRLISHFELDQGGVAPVRQGARPAKASPPARPVAAMKTVGRGGASTSPSAAPAEQGWQEF